MLNVKDIYNQLINHWSDNQAKLIIHAMADDLIEDELTTRNIVEVAQDFQEMNWQPEFELDFLEEMGISKEAFIKFVQEQGYKPTLGEDFVYIGTDEEGIEKYVQINSYAEFFKMNGVQ